MNTLQSFSNIYLFVLKLQKVSCDGKVPSEINEFLEEQKDWISSMLLKTKENIENDITSSDQEEGGRETREKKKEQEEVDEYWRTIGLIRQQFIGLQLGSELAAKEVVSKSRDQDMFVTAGSDELLHGVDHTQAVDIWGLTLINWLGEYHIDRYCISEYSIILSHCVLKFSLLVFLNIAIKHCTCLLCDLLCDLMKGTCLTSSQLCLQECIEKISPR